MYKKMTYEELLQLKSGFFETLKGILKKNRYPTLKDYLTVTSKQGNMLYHVARQECIRRTIFVNGMDEVVFYDEKEKIEMTADKATLAKMASLLRDDKKLAAQKKASVSIEQTLMQAFAEGKLDTIDGKDYLVYDIETSYASNDLSKTIFYIGYAYIVQGGKGTYRVIEQDTLSKFLDYLVKFKGYIIGFNSLAFDNPVTVHQGLTFSDRFSQEEYERLLAIIDEKSLDLYQFVSWLTKKRIGLNKLSRSLVGLGKTLESGKEAEVLWKAHQEGDKKAMTTLKEYCKNDVRMTYLALWYLLLYKKLSRENQEHEYTIQEFIIGSNTLVEEETLGDASEKVKNIFSD